MKQQISEDDKINERNHPKITSTYVGLEINYFVHPFDQITCLIPHSKKSSDIDINIMIKLVFLLNGYNIDNLFVNSNRRQL